MPSKEGSLVVSLLFTNTKGKNMTKISEREKKRLNSLPTVEELVGEVPVDLVRVRCNNPETKCQRYTLLYVGRERNIEFSYCYETSPEWCVYYRRLLGLARTGCDPLYAPCPYVDTLNDVLPDGEMVEPYMKSWRGWMREDAEQVVLPGWIAPCCFGDLVERYGWTSGEISEDKVAKSIIRAKTREIPAYIRKEKEEWRLRRKKWASE